jgi:hypothetical protein
MSIFTFEIVNDTHDMTLMTRLPKKIPIYVKKFMIYS